MNLERAHSILEGTRRDEDFDTELYNEVIEVLADLYRGQGRSKKARRLLKRRIADN